MTPDEFDALSRREVLFAAEDRRRLFTAIGIRALLLAANLHFHAATAYDILRLKGLPLQKLDYLGMPRGRDPEPA